MNELKREYVYVMGSPASPLVKIGRSTRPRVRLQEIQGPANHPLELLWVTPGGNEMERGLHRHFRAKRRIGEWFELGFADAAVLVAEVVGASGWETESFRRTSRASSTGWKLGGQQTLSPFTAAPPVEATPFMTAGQQCGKCGHDSKYHQDDMPQRCHWTGEEEWFDCQCAHFASVPNEAPLGPASWALTHSRHPAWPVAPVEAA